MQSKTPFRHSATSALFGAILALASGNASLAQVPVDVELVLAVDVSGSMSFEELNIQRQGYVAALQSDDVIKAIQSGLHGTVAITYVEWARNDRQNVVLPWTLIDGRASAEAAAKILSAAPIANMRNTSISGAIRHSVLAFDNNGFQGDRLIIDVSGDGPNNQGGLVTKARDDAVAKGITINGLPILADEWVGANSFAPGATLADYYEQCVIGGPLAFVIPVKDWPEFQVAVRRKLVLELSGRTPHDERPSGLPIVRVQLKPEPDCQIGERQRRIWQDP